MLGIQSLSRSLLDVLHKKTTTQFIRSPVMADMECSLLWKEEQNCWSLAVASLLIKFKAVFLGGLGFVQMHK